VRICTAEDVGFIIFKMAFLVIRCCHPSIYLYFLQKRIVQTSVYAYSQKIFACSVVNSVSCMIVGIRISLHI